MAMGLHLDTNLPDSRMVFLFKDNLVYRLEIYNRKDEKFFTDLLDKGYTFKEAIDYNATTYQCITRKSKIL